MCYYSLEGYKKSSDKKGWLHIESKRTALLHIRDFELRQPQRMQNPTVHEILGLLRLIIFPARVKLKYERTRMKNKAFVVQRRTTKINVVRFLSVQRAIQLGVVFRHYRALCDSNSIILFSYRSFNSSLRFLFRYLLCQISVIL